MEDDVHFARILLEAAHEQGLKAVIASEGIAGRNLALKLDLLLEKDRGGPQTEWSTSLHWYF